jgi:hypothetical protein
MYFAITETFDIADSDGKPVKVTIRVDLHGLAKKLGARAARSIGGVAVEAGGLVSVEHVRKEGRKA